MNTTEGLNVTKRLQNELMQLMMAGIPGVSAFPESDNLLSWVGTIEGAPGTAYDGLSYKLSLKFPVNYPYTAPTIKFTTPCFHPNVDSEGNICLDILKEKWSAVYNVQTILLSLQSLLGGKYYLIYKKKNKNYILYVKFCYLFYSIISS